MGKCKGVDTRGVVGKCKGVDTLGGLWANARV